MSSACGTNNEINLNVVNSPTIKPTVVPSLTTVPTKKPKINATGKNIFTKLTTITFCFLSGAGGWSTEVKMKADGTFTGFYHDSDMGNSAKSFPNGTRYECHFYGQFSKVKKINDYEFSMRIKYLHTKGKYGEEKIIDGVRVITKNPYGFDNADKFILYLPGRNTADLPKPFLSWVEELGHFLSYFGLYNVGGEQGFSGPVSAE